MRSISSLRPLCFCALLLVMGSARAQDDASRREPTSDPADLASSPGHDFPVNDPVAEATRDDGENASDAMETTAEPGARLVESCPEGAPCVPDAELLTALLGLEEALGGREGIALAIQRLAALEDPRVVPRLLELSRVRDREVRLSALKALSAFVALPVVQARMYQALEKDALPDEASLALPALLSLARSEGRPAPSRCVDEVRCTDEATLLSALLALYEASPQGRPIAVAALGALEDARAIPILWRLSYTRRTELRHAALGALARQPEDPRALRRLLEIVETGSNEDLLVVLPGLARAAGEEVTAALERARRERGDRRVQRAVEEALDWRRAAGDGAVAHAAPDGFVLPPQESGDAPRDPEDDRVKSEPVSPPLGAAHDPAQDTHLAKREPVPETEPETVLETELETEFETEPTLSAPSSRRHLDPSTLDAERFAASARWLVTGAAAFAGAYGGYASASVIADAVGARGPGFLGVDQELWYGLYGLAVGGASAGAVTWFSLGDAQLTGGDLLLSLAGGAWGAYAGALVPLAIDTGTARDLRHSAYAAAVGQLIGLGLGSAGALFVEADGSDQFELHLTLLAANGLAAGAFLSMPEGGDPRWLLGGLVGATLLGASAYPVLRPLLDFDGLDGLQLLTGSSVGFAIGLQAGLAANAFEPHPTRGFGLTLLGGALGLSTSMALGAFDARPTVGGNFYEAYATAAGSLAGIGAGMFVERMPGIDETLPRGVAPFAMGAILGLGGALSTFAFPDGVEQDAGDLLLQPLLIGYSLYHTTAALGVADVPPELTLASALVAPSLVSLAVTHAAPYINPTLGDLVLIGATTGWGAWLSALATASVAGRTDVPPSAWILATSLGMDLGIAAGAGLGLLDVDDLGWRVAYVTASAGAASLVLSVPGSLLAVGTNGAVQIPDVLLASTLIGAGVGLLTMPLIDFGIAPDIDLDSLVPLHSMGIDLDVEIQPSVQALLPTMQASETALTYGVMGTF